MGVSSGPKIKRDGLVICLDSGASIRGFTPNGTNFADNIIKNLIDKSEYPSTFSPHLTDAQYYTLYAITYPEGNYSPASRDGVTPGHNVQFGSMTYGASRSLNYYVHDGVDWVPDSYFTGMRINGHCYDLYSSTDYVSESNKFLDDYEVIKSNFPNSTHVIIASHANDRYNVTGIRETLVDLGAPKEVLSWSNGRREFVLVGRPGLGAGNAFGWGYENESGGAVAHLNSVIPYETPTANFTFDGTNEFIDFGSDIMISPNNKGWTAEYVFYTHSASTIQHFNSAEADDFNANWLAIYQSKLAVWDHGQGIWKYGDTVFNNNTWYHVAFVQKSGTNMQYYVNGEPEGGDHTSFSFSSGYSALKTRYVGRYEYNGGYSRYFNGEMPVIKLYKQPLDDNQIKRNFNSYKRRFNI